MSLLTSNGPSSLFAGSEHSKVFAYWTEVVPRIGFVGCCIGAITGKAMIPQVVNTSGGRIGQLTTPMWTRMFLRIWPKAGTLKFVQYLTMRELKSGLDLMGCNAHLSKMISFGVVGTGFQSVIYNQLIADMYKVYLNKETQRQSAREFVRSLAPGIVWCFGREMFAMGGGIALGPVVNSRLREELQRRDVELGEFPTRFLSGFASGAFTSFGTQWLHNTTLMAGRMAAAREVSEAPHYTVSSIRMTYHEFGMGMFTANFGNRLVLVAGAVALMNMVDMFHRPELRIL